MLDHIDMEKSMPHIFQEVAKVAIGDDGVFPHICIWKKDGHVCVEAVVIKEPRHVMEHILRLFLDKNPDELIYAIDRVRDRNYGIELDDFLAGAYWTGKAWKAFVMEYQNDPRIIKPLNYMNPFWKKTIREEITESFAEAEKNRLEI